MYFRTTLKSILANRYLIKNFAVKDLKSRYAESAMGFIWSIIHPLTTLAVYSLVYSWMLNMRIGSELGTTNFTLWLYAGLLPWTFFAETLSRSTSMVLDNANLIKKTIFPSEILPVSLIISNAVNYIIGFVILVTGIYITGGYIAPLSIMYIFIYIVPLIMLVLGLSWLCASLNVYFRDLGQIVSVLLNIIFFASTIIYPISVVPERFQKWFYINPMVHVVEGMRDSLFKVQLIDKSSLIYLYSFAIIVFLLGQYIFQKTKKGFVDVL